MVSVDSAKKVRWAYAYDTHEIRNLMKHINELMISTSMASPVCTIMFTKMNTPACACAFHAHVFVHDIAMRIHQVHRLFMLIRARIIRIQMKEFIYDDHLNVDGSCSAAGIHRPKHRNRAGAQGHLHNNSLIHSCFLVRNTSCIQQLRSARIK